MQYPVPKLLLLMLLMVLMLLMLLMQLMVLMLRHMVRPLSVWWAPIHMYIHVSTQMHSLRGIHSLSRHHLN